MKTNAEVLADMGLKKRVMLDVIRKRKIKYYGHIRRHETLQKKIIEGKVEGKRKRGRRRKNWISNIEETMGMKMNECCEAALDRKRWRAMISNLFNETEPR